MTATDSTAQPAIHHWNPPPLRIGVLIMIAVLALSSAIGVLYAFSLWPFDGVESTDDAYVRGRTTVIAPQVSGYVVQVAVGDYANVKRGDVLARIDDSTYRAKVDQAQAALQVVEAALANSRQASATAAANSLGDNAALARARADMTRADNLVKDGSVSGPNARGTGAGRRSSRGCSPDDPLGRSWSKWSRRAGGSRTSRAQSGTGRSGPHGDPCT
jgi:multidrug resistance efflux pump